MSVERDEWQALIDEYRADAPLDEDDLIRLALVGELDGVRSRIAALVPELPGSVVGPRSALPLVLDWVVSGTFDRSAIAAIVATFDDEFQRGLVHPDNLDSWLLFLEPGSSARQHIGDLKTWLKKTRRGWRRGEDGDADEEIGRGIEKIALFESIAAGKEVAAAFDRYLRTTFDWWHPADVLCAVAVRTLLLESALDPGQALARVRAFMPDALDAPSASPLNEDPGLQALDAIARVVDQGKGLTVSVTPTGVELRAAPQAVDPDFF